MKPPKGSSRYNDPRTPLGLLYLPALRSERSALIERLQIESFSNYMCRRTHLGGLL
jgi:hypothetical protein